MEYLGGIDNLNFKPITGYNSFLRGNASFELDKTAETEFDKVLNPKIQDIQQSSAVEKAKNSSPVQSLMGRIENAFTAGLDSVNNAGIASNLAQETLATGGNISAHDAMIAAEKATLSMNMAIQVRNKLLNAYSELQQVKV